MGSLGGSGARTVCRYSGVPRRTDISGSLSASESGGRGDLRPPQQCPNHGILCVPELPFSWQRPDKEHAETSHRLRCTRAAQAVFGSQERLLIAHPSFSWERHRAWTGASTTTREKRKNTPVPLGIEPCLDPCHPRLPFPVVPPLTPVLDRAHCLSSRQPLLSHSRHVFCIRIQISFAPPLETWWPPSSPLAITHHPDVFVLPLIHLHSTKFHHPSSPTPT